MRDEQGRFHASSGNPGGRPRETGRMRELCREHGAKAVEILAAIMMDENEPAKNQIAAARELLDRGYGRPVQTVKGEEGAPPVVWQLNMGSVESDSPRDLPALSEQTQA